MSSKSAALEIYSSYLNAGKGLISEYLAKQLSLIHVEALIEEHTWKNPLSWNESRLKYWTGVKNEINKL
jgi:hypothetical protein